MRLSVLVPAHNESASIAEVLAGIPQSLPGVESVDVFVIDDGSTDGTGDIAHTAGATVLVHPERYGLAAAFRTGLQHVLAGSTDLIATLDADGQYLPQELLLLLQSMRTNDADLVIGDRQVARCRHMPVGNRIGNIIGSAMLRMLRVADVTDASSGFRLFTRRLGAALDIASRHTYTHEMLIQAQAFGFRIAEVPVSFLPRAHGSSKLVRTLRLHIFRSFGTILKSISLHHPLKKFLFLAGLCFLSSFSAVFLSVLTEQRSLFLVLAALLFGLGLQFVCIGVLADAYESDRRIRRQTSSSITHP